MTERWFLEYRLAWIKESVEIFGHINRESIMRKFGQSAPQATRDIAEAVKRWPDLMTYSWLSKRYERNGAQAPGETTRS